MPEKSKGAFIIKLFLILGAILYFLGISPPSLIYAQQNTEPQLKTQAEFVINTETIKQLYKEGKSLYARRDYERAKEIFGRILSIDPNNKGARRYIIAAERKLEQLELNKRRAEEKAELKRKKYLDKKKKETETILERQKKENIRLLYKNGTKRYKQARYEEAKLKFEEILTLDPSNKEARKYIDLVNAKIKEITADKEGARAAQKEKEIEALYQDATKKYKNSDYEAAKIGFEEILVLDPSHKEAQRYISFIDAKIEKAQLDQEKKEAKRIREEEARRAKEKEKEIELLYKEGKDKYKIADYKAAKAKFEEVLNIDEKHQGAKKYLSLAESAMSQKELKVEALPGPGTLNLEECIDIAIKNHHPLKIADGQVRLAKQKITEARRDLFPSLSLTWDEEKGTEHAGRDFKGRKYGVEGKQPVFHGGELWFTLKQAKVRLRVAEENKKKVENELIFNVSKAFYQLVKAKEFLKQQQYLLDETEKLNTSMSKQYEQGLCPQLEFLDVQSRYNQAYFQYISANEDVKLAEYKLLQVMNIELKHLEPIEIEYALEFNKIDLELDPCINLAMQNRPEVKTNELVTDFTYYGKKIALSKGYPRVDLTGSFGEAGEAYKEDSLNLEDEWAVGTKVSIPFGGNTGEYSFSREKRAPVLSAFQGTEAILNSFRISILDNLKYYSDLTQAGIEHEQAKYDLDKIRQEVSIEVKEAFFEYEKAVLHLDAAKSRAGFQVKEVEIFKVKREFGEPMETKIAESLTKYAQEQNLYIQAIVDCYIAISTLNKSIGIKDYFKL